MFTSREKSKMTTLTITATTKLNDTAGYSDFQASIIRQLAPHSDRLLRKAIESADKPEVADMARWELERRQTVRKAKRLAKQRALTINSAEALYARAGAILGSGEAQ